MRLTHGQARQLRLMHASTCNYSDEALRRFFNYTDRGLSLDDLKFYTTDALAVEVASLLLKFKWLGMRDSIWTLGFQEGTLLPQDFALDYESNDFEEAKRVDTVLQGFERSVWQRIRGC